MSQFTVVRQRRKQRKKLCKFLFRALGLIATISLGLLAYLYWPRSLPPKPLTFTLIAHRGVSQTFPLDNLQNDTCTAKIINPPTHSFLENTISSIRAAFNSGADLVEIDIHPTTDHHLAVFHDWTVDCRTNGQGVTHEQSMQTLKQLDIGYGYNADGGQTHPLTALSPIELRSLIHSSKLGLGLNLSQLLYRSLWDDRSNA